MANKEKFVETMNKVREDEIKRLTKKLEEAQHNDWKEISISVNDGYFFLTALLNHFDAEMGFKEDDTDK